MTGRRDARDDRPSRERRSKAGNAARLADMADLSADAAEERRHYEAAIHAGTRLGELLDECAAERDRLRVIVDLACAEHEALRAYMASEVTEPGTEPWVVWQSAREDCHDAVDEEVARRAAL